MWPGAVAGQTTSCGTLGWVMAVSDAALRRPEQDPDARMRLYRLSHRFSLDDVAASLQASLSPSDLKTVTTFLGTARTRSAATPYVPDPFLRWSASQASSVVGRAQCGAGGTQMLRSSGPSTRDAGADASDGRVYQRRESDGFLTRETIERIAVGLVVAAAFAALVAAIRFTAVLARRHKRHTCGMACLLTGDGDRIAIGRMIDLSEGGSKIAVGHAAFATGERVDLRVGGRDLESEVIWTSEAAIGLRFDTALDAPQVRDLVRKAKMERNAQKRARRRNRLSEV